MGQKAGEKWTAAAALQPTFLLSPTLLAAFLGVRTVIGEQGAAQWRAARIATPRQRLAAIARRCAHQEIHRIMSDLICRQTS
jgi:hypothetical protein